MGTAFAIPQITCPVQAPSRGERRPHRQLRHGSAV